MSRSRLHSSSHDDRLGSVVDELSHLLAHVIGLDGDENVADGIDPLFHCSHQIARNERCRPLSVGHIALFLRVEAGTVSLGAGDVDGVLKSVGHDCPDPGAFGFDQSVGAEGGGVPD